MKAYRVEIETQSHGPLVLEVLADNVTMAVEGVRGLFHQRHGAGEAKIVPHDGDTFLANFTWSSLRGTA